MCVYTNTLEIETLLPTAPLLKDSRTNGALNRKWQWRPLLGRHKKSWHDPSQIGLPVGAAAAAADGCLLLAGFLAVTFLSPHCHSQIVTILLTDQLPPRQHLLSHCAKLRLLSPAPNTSGLHREADCSHSVRLSLPSYSHWGVLETSKYSETDWSKPKRLSPYGLYYDRTESSQKQTKLSFLWAKNKKIKKWQILREAEIKPSGSQDIKSSTSHKCSDRKHSVNH